MGFQDNVNVDVRGAAHIAPCTYKTVVLKQNVTKQNLNVLTQAMLDEYGANTKFVIKWDYVLKSDITIPANCILKFDGGSINGHSIICNSTKLTGKNIQISNIKGTIRNKTILTSWFIDSPSNDIFDVMSNSNGSIFVDKNIILKGGSISINNIKIEGDNIHFISNPPQLTILGDCISILNTIIKEMSFSGSFIYISNLNINNEISIELNNSQFDGNNICTRILNRLGTQDSSIYGKLSIQNCKFSNILEVAIKYSDVCTGILTNNEFKEIGSFNVFSSNQGGIFLGGGYNISFYANDVVINNNLFKNIKCVYSDVEDAKETHAILVYGYNVKIVGNYVDKIISSRADEDPGTETEGIYVKGYSNEISNNYLYYAVGKTNSDGAITLKGIGDDSRDNNTISQNTIILRWGRGIVYYGNFGTINENYITHKGDEARAFIDFLVASNNIVKNNILKNIAIFDTQKKNASCAFAINDGCDNNIFEGNKLYNIATLAVIYSSGYSVFSNNVQEMTGVRYNNNVSYGGLIYTADYSPKLLLKNNVFMFKGTAGTSLMNTPATIDSINNIYIFENADDIVTTFYYIIRNTETGASYNGSFNSFNDIFKVISGSVTFGDANNKEIKIINISVEGNMQYDIKPINCFNIGFSQYGTTSERPQLPSNYYIGFKFFDTTLNKPIYWKGNKWIDATGTEV